MRRLATWGPDTLLTVTLPIRGGAYTSEEECCSEDAQDSMHFPDPAMIPDAPTEDPPLPSHLATLYESNWFPWAVAEDWLALNYYGYAAGWSETIPCLLFGGAIGASLVDSRCPGTFKCIKEALRAAASSEVTDLAYVLSITIPLPTLPFVM